MSRFLARLMFLIAVLLMPLGMAAPATAEPMPNMAMSHCPDQDSNGQQKGVSFECTMACASALPALDSVPGERPPATPMQFAVASPEPLHGVDPDTATPPPKCA